LDARLSKLLRLANFLDDLPHDRFHMPDWCSDDATETHCGTAGCAAGWAVSLYWREGFILKDGTPSYAGAEDCRAGAFAAFFGITEHEAEWITCTLGLFDEGVNDHDHSVRLDDFMGTADRFIVLPASDFDYPSYCREYGIDSPDLITPWMAADQIRKVIAWHDAGILEESNEQTVSVVEDIQ